MSQSAITTNGFLKGLNVDLSKTKQNNQQYQDALNIRLVTDQGLGTGSIENVKGTSLLFKLPSTLSSATYGTESVPAQENLQIIGWEVIGSNIIIFSTSHTQNSPNSKGFGQVWKLPYDEAQEEGVDLTGTLELDPTVHLIYNRYLNFSVNHRIKVVCRYESDKILRVYWLDGINPMRVVNTSLPFVLGVNNMQAFTASSIDISPDVNLNAPVITELLEGNLPNGRIQYAYRLLNKEGALTRFSPVTPLIDLAEGAHSGDYYEYPELDEEDDFKGLINDDKKDKTNSEKSVRLLLNNIDTRYHYLQVAYVLYTTNNIPLIGILPELEISNSTMSFIHSGNEGTEVIITKEEFNALSSPFDIPKSAETKDNILFAANTKSSQFDVDFDARAYRFKANQTSTIVENSQGVTTTVTTSNWSNLNPLHDCINPFNDDNPNTNSDWLTDTYKYQPGTTILGGKGPNVEYKFFKINHAADVTVGGTLNRSSAPFIKAKKYPIDQYDGSFETYKNPHISSKFVGHARGEVYRYGIVFYDKKGNESFVKWIGDIKFPFYYDENGTWRLSTFTNSTELLLQSIGLELKVTIPENIATKISGYKFVRVERKEEWRTKLGTGITGSFFTINDSQRSWDNFKQVLENILKWTIAGILSTIPLFGGLGGVFSFVSDSLFNLVWERVEAALEELKDTTIGANGGDIGQITEEQISTILTSAFGAIGGNDSGAGLAASIITKVITSIMSHVSDFLKGDVGGVGQKVACISASYSTGDATTGTQSASDLLNHSGIARKKVGYVISPIVSFNKYNFKTGDYLKALGEFRNANSKLVNTYHTDKTTGMLLRNWSHASVRKWYDPHTRIPSTAGDPDDWEFRHTIDAQEKMDVGEVVRPGKSSLLNDFSYTNAHMGSVERFQNPASLWNSGLRIWRALGIGDRKHLVTFANTFSARHSDTFLPESATFTPTSDPQSNLRYRRLIDVYGDYLVGYERYVQKQYGGNSYSERANNTYIDASDFIAYTSGVASTVTTAIMRGDTYTCLFDAVNYAYYFNHQAGYNKPLRVKKALAEIFPCEVPFNVEMRYGEHFAKDQDIDSLDEESRREKRKRRRELRKAKKRGENSDSILERLAVKRFLHDQFRYDDIYSQVNNTRLYFPKPLLNNFQDVNVARIWKTRPKIDGEIIDSWRNFQFLNYLDVDGNQGPINHLVTHNNRLMFYQERAIGVASVNERSSVQDEGGATLQLASGGVLSRYDYITTETGLQHRFAVVKSNSNLYHFDALREKMFSLSGEGLQDMSTNLGLSSLFRYNTAQDIKVLDRTLAGVGIHGAYDAEFNTVYFTFLGNAGDRGNYTLAYNEKTQAYESFYSFTPGAYLKAGNKFLSINPSVTKECHIHNRGVYGEFYGTSYPAYIKYMTNEGPYITKVFDNIFIHSEVYDTNNILLNETVNQLRVSNDHQISSLVTLTPNSNIKILERMWSLAVPRDSSTSPFTSFKPRMRDRHMTTELWYNNNNNKRLVLHDVNTIYRKSDS